MNIKAPFQVESFNPEKESYESNSLHYLKGIRDTTLLSSQRDDNECPILTNKNLRAVPFDTFNMLEGWLQHEKMTEGRIILTKKEKRSG